MHESALLEHIYQFNASLSQRVTIPPGDDMGAVRIGDADVLITVDQVADGVHVDLAATPLDKVARKAITRNLSDVAAMAALPVGAVVAGCLPRCFGEDRANALFDAMRATAQAYGCPLIGGDISMWDQPMVLTVTVLAEPAGIDPVTRIGAQVGDLIYVTGRLGGSLETVDGYTHHLDFEPRLALALRLAGDPATRPHCLIDLSDGLGKDLSHLCRAGQVTAQVRADALPISQAAQQASAHSGQPAWRHAVGDGEDYELCFTLGADEADRLPTEIDGVPITPIGQITPRGDGPLITLTTPDGSTEPLEDMGWEHHS